MDVAALDVPAALVAHYEAAGIESLYPPQAAAVDAGITAGRSLVAAVPTASGKTLIAELAMATTPGVALYVVPLRALADEKAAGFRDLPDVSVGVTTADYAASDGDLGDNDIVVATSEKVDSLIRHGASWLDDVTCLVLDEVHLLDSAERGPTLEVTAAKLRALVPGVQVVALSATVGNPDAVADWLDAALVESAWRPIELRTGVFVDDRIVAADGSERSVRNPTQDPVPGLVAATHGDGAGTIVFVHSRRAAEALAGDLADRDLATAPTVAAEIRETAATDTGDALAAAVDRGVAFHHAGLRREHRAAVERAFRDRGLAAVVATPTLAAGVNLPARRVVVRDAFRYTDDGRTPLSVLEVHQMFGRAGRPGLDPHGEALLVADDRDEAERLGDRYLDAAPEAITSRLASQDALRAHVLSTVASGFASTRDDLLAVLEGTFYAAQEDPGTLLDIADLVIDDLVDLGMLAPGDGLDATALGEQVSKLYVDPRTGARLADRLPALAARATVPELALLELVCDTPDMGVFYLRGGDWADLAAFAEANEDVLARSVDGFDGEDFGEWLASIKTARALEAVAAGASEREVTEAYGVGPGDLRLKVDRAVWLLAAAEAIASARDLAVADDLAGLRAALEA